MGKGFRHGARHAKRVGRRGTFAASPVEAVGTGPALHACPCCDLLQSLPALRPGDRALCSRCGHELARQPRFGLDWCLPLAVAAAILLLIANLTPLMALSAGGRTSSTTILGGVIEMWSEGERATATIVAFCAVIAPTGFIGGVLLVLLATRRPPAPHWVGEVLRWMRYLRVWSLQEVMMLGILVALVKISELASVDAGVGIFSVGALTLLLPVIYATFDTRALWDRDRVDRPDEPRARGTARRCDDAMTRPAATAADAGLLACSACCLVCRPATAAEPGYCARCGERLESRRPRSLERATALLSAAAICYVPANALPVLTTSTLGTAEQDTILGGVMLLYSSGSWFLALIVLVASVIIPLGKLLALGYLLLAVRRGAVRGGHDQARLYHIVEFIGRWSMLDVFVDAYTVALVQLQPMVSVAPAPGILFFAAVVVLTMLAAEYFDPRLIWDAADGDLPKHAA